MTINRSLLRKYNVPVPRYTSYPTVPYWDTARFSISHWQESMLRAYWQNAKEISIYIHLPFCESLCTYCGCHTHITKNHGVESPYIETLLKEWRLYLDLLPEKPILKELHLGGGTPTFFAAQQLIDLVSQIRNDCDVPDEPDYGFEGHPRNTNQEHLLGLLGEGFSRISLGIQDFDLQVQKAINRIQSLDQVRSVTESARAAGYRSINYDLIYGLPHQTADSVTDTFRKVADLDPDRIAFYSYAHVPKLKPAQRSYEQFLPNPESKTDHYLLGRELLFDMGYEEVGMDHFAKPEDALAKAARTKDLHRNFMGYTTSGNRLIIGLGVSAIGDCWDGFVQNHKNLRTYSSMVDQGLFPISKGHNHTKADLFLRRLILDVMCQGETKWSESELDFFGLEIDWNLLDILADDGLLVYDPTGLKVSTRGFRFLRNIGSAFDGRMNRGQHPQTTFSKAV